MNTIRVMSAVRPTMARNPEVILEPTRRHESRSRRSISLGWTWTKSNPEQVRVIRVCPIARQPPDGQDLSIITLVGVAPPPRDGIASDHRAMAGRPPMRARVTVL